MKKLILFLILINYTSAFSQENKGVIIKSNVLNFLAKRPAISAEIAISPTISLEGSYVSGKAIAIPFIGDYEGFLLRGKKYLSQIQKNKANLYYGAYAGNLERTIYREGYIHPTGFFGVSTRDFSSNSIRTGGSFGILFIPTKSNFVIDGSGSLGYGKYFNMENRRPQAAPKGYFDVQLWFSIGYVIK